MTAQRIIQHVFHQPALSQLPIAALEELVTEYPYFTAARLLLAQKNYEQYPSLHSPAVKKAQLYTNNPHYFFQFVTGELEKVPAPAESQSFSSFAPVEAEKAPEQASAYSWEQPKAEEKAPEQGSSYSWEQAAEEEKESAQTSAYSWEQAAAAENGPEQVSDRSREQATEEEEEAPDQQEEKVETEPEQPLVAPLEEEETAEETPAVAFTEETIPAITKITDLIAPWEEETPAAMPETAFTEAATPPAETTPETAEKAPWEEQEEETAANQSFTPAEAASQPITEDTAARNDEEPIKIFPLEIPEEETTLTFQPLYTDDYFAYKRLKDPENAEELNDKGMRDMRSFTEWLREMKQSFAKKADKDWYHQQLHRIYVDDEPEVSEAVEKMAMESITLNDDIVSETLAEIWARQHQYQTAIQIYQKLSLLNPNKSAYFAQKIQELQLQQAESGKN